MTKRMDSRLFEEKKFFYFSYGEHISMHTHLNDYNKIQVNLKILDIRLVMRIKLY